MSHGFYVKSPEAGRAGGLMKGIFANKEYMDYHIHCMRIQVLESNEGTRMQKTSVCQWNTTSSPLDFCLQIRMINGIMELSRKTLTVPCGVFPRNLCTNFLWGFHGFSSSFSMFTIGHQDGPGPGSTVAAGGGQAVGVACVSFMLNGQDLGGSGWSGGAVLRVSIGLICQNNGKP